MVRETLADIPLYLLPSGYTIRWYQPGDEARWTAIQAAADHYNEITPSLFHAQFQAVAAHLEDRQCYLLDSAGDAIGTATAWVDDLSHDPARGRIHWVAIVPSRQGRGLAKPLMTVVCQRLQALGHQKAYLTTSLARLAAIQLYLNFGFVPLLAGIEQQKRWPMVLERLQQRAGSSPFPGP
jgi:GNAT superfamily N-acetyltransferase